MVVLDLLPEEEIKLLLREIEKVKARTRTIKIARTTRGPRKGVTVETRANHQAKDGAKKGLHHRI